MVLRPGEAGAAHAAGGRHQRVVQLDAVGSGRASHGRRPKLPQAPANPLTSSRQNVVLPSMVDAPYETSIRYIEQKRYDTN